MQRRLLSNGQIITLSSTGMGGGEGDIYNIKEVPNSYAKVYHSQKLTTQHSHKLRVMSQNPPHNPLAKTGKPLVAWPVDLLCPVSSSEIDGFMMLRVTGSHPLVNCYTPNDRSKTFKSFNYLSLHRVAYNLVTAIHSVHKHECVIGDVNESNILVDESGIVTLVDADSFQVQDKNGTIYPCPVGKPEYTPPELQGLSCRSTQRTPQQDFFGMAVLIFQLLMEGWHPFDGAFQGSGDVPEWGDRIKNGHFPHGKKPVPYRPGPLTPPFDILHPDIQSLFVQCFEEGHGNPYLRPDTKTWMKALEVAERNLQSCSINQQHRYSNHLNSCPWCSRTGQSFVFTASQPFPKVTTKSVSSIPSILTTVPSYTNPSLPPLQPSLKKPSVTQSNITGQQKLTSSGLKTVAVVILAGVSIAGMWFGFGEPQVKSSRILQQAREYKQQEKYEDCINQAKTVSQSWMVLPNYHQSAQELLVECQSGFNVQTETLKQAKKLAEEGRLIDAIEKASKVKGTELSLLYQEAKALITQLGNRLLGLAEEKFQKGQLQQAIDQARAVPPTSETAILLQQVEVKINQWQKTWKIAEDKFEEAQQFSREGKWQAVIDISDKMPPIQFWQTRLKPIVQVARFQRNAELEVEGIKNLEAGVLRGEIMVRDTSRVWEKLPWPQGWHGEKYGTRPAAWKYVQNLSKREAKYSRNKSRWCWWVYVYDSGYYSKSKRFRQICDGVTNDFSPRPKRRMTVGEINAYHRENLYKWVGNYDKRGNALYRYSAEKTLSCNYAKEEKPYTSSYTNLCNSPSWAATRLTRNLPIP